MAGKINPSPSGKPQKPVNDAVTNIAQSSPNPSLSSPNKTAAQNRVSGNGSYDPNAKVPSVNGNAFLEQSGKHFGIGNKVRFTMSLGNFTFQAHLDPNDISRQQQKRIAQLDVIGGVVVQDFGYKAEILEVKGTTGSRYYDAIKEMNDIFLHQNLGAPSEVAVTLDGTSYSAVLQQFNFGRQINQGAGNLVNYQMQFIILSVNVNNSNVQDKTALGSNSVKQMIAANAGNTLTGKSSMKTIPWQKSINDYINAQTGVVKTHPDQVRTFLQNNWPSQNGSFPGPDKVLGAKGVLTVPSDWSSVIV